MIIVLVSIVLQHLVSQKCITGLIPPTITSVLNVPHMELLLTFPFVAKEKNQDLYAI